MRGGESLTLSSSHALNQPKRYTMETPEQCVKSV